MQNCKDRIWKTFSTLLCSC